MKRIAVTGGNGLLGRYVVAALEPDYEVTVIDRSVGDAHQPHGPIDVLDLGALAGALRGQDAVVHLAAIDAANDATPQAFFHTNVLAAWNVLHCGYEAGARRYAANPYASPMDTARAGRLLGWSPALDWAALSGTERD